MIEYARRLRKFLRLAAESRKTSSECFSREAGERSEPGRTTIVRVQGESERKICCKADKADSINRILKHYTTEKTRMFITFEGGEGAGKTTLIEEIFHYLTSRGYQVLKTREPGGTSLGEKIRSLVLESKERISPRAELALFLGSRAQHVDEVIKPALKAGKIVLCDRFNDSSVAYQGIARNLGKDEVEKACSFFSSGLVPALTFYLDVDPKIGMHRVQRSRVKDRIEQEDFSFHTLVRNAFLTIAKQTNRMVVIDASLPRDQVQQLAIKKLCSIIS